jgi:hypothetical protein
MSDSVAQAKLSRYVFFVRQKGSDSGQEQGQQARLFVGGFQAACVSGTTACTSRFNSGTHEPQLVPHFSAV